MKRIIPRRTVAERKAIAHLYYERGEGERKIHYRAKPGADTPCNVQGARRFTSNIHEISCITCQRELELLTP